ncbi:MAG: CHASE2 domain-containing protein [Burkholderiales bacterium]
MRRHTIPIALGLAVLLVFLAHAAKLDFTLINRFENLSYDARLLLTMPHSKDNRVVIVDIDEKSLAEEGRWPWGRDRLALMMNQLFDRYRVALVAFDVVFAEPDVSSGINVLQNLAQQELQHDATYRAVLEQIRPRLDHDAQFAKVLEGRPVVLGYYFNPVSDAVEARQSGMLPNPTLPAGAFAGRTIPFVGGNGYGANLAEFQRAAKRAGHFVPFLDDDGITRRVPMLMEYKGAYYESLSLAIMRTLLGISNVEPIFPTGRTFGYTGLEWLKLGNLYIPVDERVNALVPYRGKKGSFKYISATDVIHGRASVADLKDAVALVGTSAPGLQDLRAAPMEASYPGVEIHANLVAGMLDRSIKQKPAYVRGAEIVTLLVLGLVLSIVLPMLSPLKAALASAVASVLVLGINLLAWSSGNLVLPLASSIMLVVILFVLSMSYGYFIEARGKRQLAGVFGQYVPPELVEKMGENPQKFTQELMEGQRREMTVLFSDVRNFTSMSEGLTPKQLSQMLNEYLTVMTNVIQKHNGTIDKYIGDAIMAFWGAPLEDPQHARHALLAAMEMQAALVDLRIKFKEKGWPEIKTGAGVNSGEINVGNMGSEFRMAYTVLGDPVNLASRLEGLTKQYGVTIMVGEATKKAIPDMVFRELDRVRVKGKEEPVAIFEPLGLEGQVDKTVLDELKLFHRTLALYREQNWDMAEVQLLSMLKSSPHCYLYKLYMERIGRHRTNPPPSDWGGVTVFETK